MYQFVKALVLPPVTPILAIFIGLVLMRWAPRSGKALAWLGLVILYLLSTPVVSVVLNRAVEVPPTLEGPVIDGAKAIVVLSAGTEPSAPEFGGETVDPASLIRLRYAAALHRKTDLPILVSGGLMPLRYMPIASLMEKALIEDFQVPVRWVEEKSTTTAENAAFSKRLLEPEGIDTIVLVTEAYHMRRSAAVFEAQGFKVVPAPTATRAVLRLSPGIIAPQSGALNSSTMAVHELIGYLWYDLMGRV